MKKKPGRPRKVLSASERKAVVKLLRSTRNITATVNNLKATGFDISRTRVQAVAREEKLEFKPGAPPVRLTDRERRAVLSILERTHSVAATVSELRDKGAPSSYWCVRSVAKAAGMNLKPGPVPRALSKSDRVTVIACLRKTRSITATVADLRRKGKPLSNARVRAVATTEGFPLDHELRRAATPQIMELAKTLRAKGESATAISDAVYDAIGYDVTPQYINKMLTTVKSRRSPRR